jgi:hypothetical protein
MQNRFLPLFPILLVILAGVFLPLLFLRQTHPGDLSKQPFSDQSGRLLSALLLLAFISVGLFIFFLVFNFW